jgi:hypothetical protein
MGALKLRNRLWHRGPKEQRPQERTPLQNLTPDGLLPATSAEPSPDPRPEARRYAPRMRDIETIDSELQLVATLRHAARERGGPLPSVDVADALLDERGELAEWGNQFVLICV